MGILGINRFPLPPMYDNAHLGRAFYEMIVADVEDVVCLRESIEQEE